MVRETLAQKTFPITAIVGTVLFITNPSESILALPCIWLVCHLYLSNQPSRTN